MRLKYGKDDIFEKGSVLSLLPNASFFVDTVAIIEPSWDSYRGRVIHQWLYLTFVDNISLAV
jgi:hypothetical protein